MKNERKEAIFEVLCGSYEEYLLGYKLYQEENGYRLEQTIADHSHRASLRSIAAHNNHLASGGADENIHLYNLIERQEAGLLMHHTGTVTSLEFTPDGTHLISGSEDGSIAILRVGNWAMEKIWTKAHRGMPVNDISIHPSGKMALSVGADKTLKTWNLIKGRPAYTINLASKCIRPEIISWSRCGKYFALVNDKCLDVYSISSAAVEKSIRLSDRITCIDFLEEDQVCLGDWAGNVTCYNFLNGDKKWEIKPSELFRIKSIVHTENWLIAANSQGNLTIYDIKESPSKVTETKTFCRITCMTISQINEREPVVKKKRKKMKMSQEVASCPLEQKWSVTTMKDEKVTTCTKEEKWIITQI